MTAIGSTGTKPVISDTSTSLLAAGGVAFILFGGVTLYNLSQSSSLAYVSSTVGIVVCAAALACAFVTVTRESHLILVKSTLFRIPLMKIDTGQFQSVTTEKLNSSAP